MRLVLAIGFLALLSVSVWAQYWIGPKIGYHYTIHNYQDDSYLDNYMNRGDHNFEVGMALTYTISDRYSVHGELFYEKIF